MNLEDLPPLEAKPEDWRRLYDYAAKVISAANAYDWSRASRWMAAYITTARYLEDCGAPEELLRWHRVGMMFAIRGEWGVVPYSD